jgi:hypothetical protein
LPSTSPFSFAPFHRAFIVVITHWQVLLGQGELPILEACRSTKVTLCVWSMEVHVTLCQAVPFGIVLSLHGVPKTKM